MYKILIVDDDSQVRFSLGMILRRAGHVVMEASNGNEAIDIFSNERPCVVLLDLMMPGIDGIETLKELQKIDSLVPVIMITGYGDVSTAVDAIKHGAYDFTLKPTDINRLLITIHKAIEKQDLERQNQKLLIQQSKLATLGEMIGSIAHQWKQPLSSINLIIQDLEDAYANGEMNKEYLDDSVKSILEQTRYMSETIGDFRQFFKPDKEKKSFDILKSIREVYSLIERQLRSLNIAFSIHCRCDKKTECDALINLKPCEHNYMAIKGYPNEFKQVVLNIVNNARDAIVDRRTEGKIGKNEIGCSVAIGCQAIKGNIKIQVEKQAGSIRVAVNDNGGGIPESVIDKIFEPYITTKQGDKGTGIGLYMSKVIIKNMGGRLFAHNIGNGAMFTIEFFSDIAELS
ncbi:MAG: response regulator [Nitrospirae bacterium]|nr:response regulator [Nitrospirota bacterium]